MTACSACLALGFFLVFFGLCTTIDRAWLTLGRQDCTLSLITFMDRLSRCSQCSEGGGFSGLIPAFLQMM